MKKTRLTITLSTPILNRLDLLIDGQHIRNRSHAIEHILMEKLQPQITTAVILAGGKHNEKLDTIRPLIVFNHKPLIVHHLELLAKNGISQVYISTSKHGRKIQDLVGDGKNFGLKVEYFFEDTPLGTAGAINHWQNKINSTFVVLGADLWTDININGLVQFHLNQQAIATLAVKPKPTTIAYDNVVLQGSRVTDFQPGQTKAAVGIINTGIYVFEPSIFKFIPHKSMCMLERDVFPVLSKANKLAAFLFQEPWFDIPPDSQSKIEINEGDL